MSKTWIEFQRNQGANIINGNRVQTGNTRENLKALTEGGTLLCDLSHLGLLEVSGQEAKTFLQGQFTNDLEKLDSNHGQRNGYCTPKGRMLAVFTTFQLAESYYLQLPSELLETIEKRLRMYVLRAKVALGPNPSIMCFGLAGDNAGKILEENGFPSLSSDLADLEMVSFDKISIIRVAGSSERYLVVSPIEQAMELWQKLAEKCTEANGQVWRWLDIQAGIPNVFDGTSEAFTPQMANMDAVNGLNFKKGCYPGQEIVARTRYLGKLKQRMVCFHVETDEMDEIPGPGTSLYAESFGEQSAGKVVDAVQSPGRGIDLLAVAQIKCVENETLRLGKVDGPEMLKKALPYSLEEPGNETG